jgi:hypothetical protein
MSRSRDPGDSRELSRSRPSVMSASLSGNRSAVKGMTFPGCRWPCTRIRSRTETHHCSAEPRLLDGGLCRRPASTNRILYWLANVFRRSLPFDQSWPAIWTASACRKSANDENSRSPRLSNGALRPDGYGRTQRSSRHDAKTMSKCPTPRAISKRIIGLGGQISKSVSSPSRKNIPVHFRPKSPAYLLPSGTHKRDVSRSSRTLGAGCDGRRWRQRRERYSCGRRSRVVLTPRRWRQVGESNFIDDGGKQARSPGRARNKP